MWFSLYSFRGLYIYIYISILKLLKSFIESFLYIYIYNGFSYFFHLFKIPILHFINVKTHIIRFQIHIILKNTTFLMDQIENLFKRFNISHRTNICCTITIICKTKQTHLVIKGTITNEKKQATIACFYRRCCPGTLDGGL